VVILTTLKLVDEIVCCLNIRNHGIFELTDFGLKGVAAIEKDNLITALFHQLVHLSRLKMLSTVLNSGLLYNNFFWGSEGN